MSGRDRLADFQAQSNNQNQGYGRQQQGGNQYGGNQYGGNQYNQNQYGNQYGQQNQQQYGQQNQYGNQYNQQNQNQFAQQNQYSQQSSNYGQQQPAPARIEMTNVQKNTTSGGDINAFFSEVTAIQEDIARIDQNVSQIEGLHQFSVDGVYDADKVSRTNRQLEALTADTTQLSNRTKKRIKDIELANLRLANSPDIQIRRTQAAALKEKFLKSLRNYQTSESESRKAYQDRMARQYKIVKPDASRQEIEQALESDNQQIFAQSVLQTTRYGEASRALNEVQSRHDDIKKIEKTILELHQLFIDMETLVTEQAEMLNTIEESTQQTDVHLETGNKEVDVAIVNARGARRKKWICLIISLVLLIIIVVVVLQQLGVFSGSGSKK